MESNYRSGINKILNMYHIELVVYDEIEFFRKYDDDEFSYPY